MAVPTSRTKTKGNISINTEKCTGCGLCVSVCKDFSLKLLNGKVVETDNPLFECFACGHCMAICPTGAITVTGRELSSGDLMELPGKETLANYGKLLNLLTYRRSIREFTSALVEKTDIDAIIKAASTAPMGLPPSDVNVLVFDHRDKVNQFAHDFCDYLQKMKWMTSNWFLTIMRPFWGQANDELFRKFLKPMFQTYIENMKHGQNLVTYDAPLAIYFYGSPYCDPADPIIAATYAMIAGESLGLGSCMLGGIHPMIQKGKAAAKFRKAQGIKQTSREGIFVIFGHPAVTYQKSLHRTFASVDFRCT